MRKNFMLWMILALVLGMLVMSGCGASAPSGGGAGSSTSSSALTIFTNIITLNYLTTLGIIQTPIDPMEGFVRILLLLVLFALLFKGAELLKLGTNISIVIALVFSLIAVIFTPGTIILAAATSYGTIFSVIILGLPILLGVGGYFFLKDHLWLRTILMGVIWLVLSQMWRYMQTLAGGATAAYSTVVHTMASWIGWVEWLVIVLFFISLIQAFISLSSGKKHSDVDVKSGAKWVWNKYKSHESRQKTALMNEYVEEQKEIKNLETVQKIRDEAVDAIDTVLGANEIKSERERKRVIDMTEKVGNALKNARNEFRRVKGRTWRQENKYNQLKKDLREKGKDTSSLDALEAEILKKHEDALKAVAADLTDFGKLSAHLTAIKGITPLPHTLVAGAGGSKKTLEDLKKGLAGLTLTNAKNAQLEAEKAVEGIIAEFKRLESWVD